MSKTTLEQGTLAREQIERNFERATGSSRAALSAISGRNILKTKEETEKIKRDKEIAAQMNAAKIAAAQAEGTVQLEKSRLQYEIENQNRSESRRQFEETLAEKKRQTNMTLDERMRQFKISLEEDERQFDLKLANQDDQFLSRLEENRRQNDARLSFRAEQFDRDMELKRKADQRENVMALLSAGVYHSAFAGVLGMSDASVKSFSEKRAQKIREQKEEREKVARAKREFEEAKENIRKLKEKKDNNEKWYEQKIRESVKKNRDKTGDADETKEAVIKESGADKVNLPLSEENAKALYDPAGYIANGTSAVMKNPALAKAEGEKGGYKEEKKRIDKTKEVKKKQENAEAKQHKEAAAYYDKLITEQIRKKEKAEQTLSSLEENYKKKYGKTTAFAIRTAEYDFNVAVDSGDMNQIKSSFNTFLGVLGNGIQKVDASARASILTAFGRKSNLEELTQEERTDLSKQRIEVELLIDTIDRVLTDYDFDLDQQDALLGAKKNFADLLKGIDAGERYFADYLKNADFYKEQREYRELDDQYYDYSVEELEEIHAKEISSLKKELVQIDQRMGWYERGHLQYTDQYKADAERKKEIEDLIAEKYDDKKGLAGYIKTRKTNEKNDASYEAVVKAAENGYQGKTIAEKITAYRDDIHQQKNEWQAYLAALSWRGNHETGYLPPYPHEITEDNEVYFIFGDGSKMYLGRYENGKITGGRAEDQKKARKEVDRLLGLEQEITGVYHREVMNFAEDLMTDEGAEEKAKKFSLDGFSEIAKEYRHGGTYFDGNYKDYQSDVEGFAKGEFGYFKEEQAKRILALLADGENDLAFSYYANAREQALLSEAEDLNKWWAGAKGAASGLTKFLTQGGYMIENALTQSYERMAGTLGTASHQVTVERLDEMGFGGDALKTAYLGAYTILDMIPAVALGAAGNAILPGIGTVAASGYIFSKSMATTYTEDIAAGKRADEALTHGVLVGTAEVAMEKILGGIPQIASKAGIGEKLSEALVNLASTKGGKMAVRIASSAGAEGFEEFLQEVASPFLEKIAADLNGIEDAELAEIDWEEAGQSFLLGAITGGFFSAVNLPSENRALEIEAARTLQSGEVTELIELGAKLGNKRALSIKEAMQNQTPRYKNQQGLAAFASINDITNIQKSIRSRKVKSAAKKVSGMIEANMEGADPAEIKSAKRIFRKVLSAQTLTLEESSAIAKDERLLSVLEGMMGEQLLGKDISPREIALLARLASFTDESGKVSKARLALFKDAFGEFDTKTIGQILHYDSMAGILEDGVIYEGETALDETQQEAAETLNVLSEMSGIHFLVTDQHQTGDYLASGLMAVNSANLDQGIFYAVGHQAYQMIMQLDPERGESLRAFVLKETKKTLGEKGLEKAIRKIMKQKYLRGFDCSRSMAEDELCAQLMPGYLLRDGYQGIDELAKTDIEAANALRKILGAIQNNIAAEVFKRFDLVSYSKKQEENWKGGNIVVYKSDEQFGEYIDDAKNKKNLEKKMYFGAISPLLAKRILSNSGIDVEGFNVTLRASEIRKIFKDHGTEKTEAPRGQRPVTEDDIKKFVEVICHADVIELDSDLYEGKPLIKFMKNIDGFGTVCCYVSKKHKDLTVQTMYINKNNRSLATAANGNSPRQTPKANVGTTSVNNSISNSFENVNGNFLRQFYGSLGQGVSEVQARITDLIKQDRAERYGWRNGELQPRPGTSFDPETDAVDSLFTAEEVAAQNDGADFTKEFSDMDPFEQAQFAADRQVELDALFEMESEEAKRAAQNVSSYMALLSRTASDIAEDNASPEARVSTEVQEEEKTIGEKVGESWNYIQRKLVDSADAVYDIGRREKDPHLYQYFNMARSSSNAGISMIQNQQTDIYGQEIGKGLNEIFSPIMKKGKAYYGQFQYYLFHLHNIDRMSRESIERTEQAQADFELIAECYPEFANLSERDIRRIAEDWSDPMQPAAMEYIKALDFKEQMKAIRNIPVFGYDVTAEISEGKVQNLLREHPEFKEMGQEVHRYLDNLLQYRVDSGLISKEFADELRAIYPHYVPTRRAQAEETVEGRKGKRTTIGKTVGRADGGNADLVPLHKQIADQTLSVVREGSKNRFAARLLELARRGKIKEVLDFEKSSDRMIGISEFEGSIDKMDPFRQEGWENLFMVYDKGIQYTLSVTPELMEAIQSLSPDQEKTFWLEEQSHKAVNLYKALITSYNPAFAVRNFARDIQDAFLYSKDLKGFIRNYPAAWKEIATNGEYWRQYQALGGTYSSIFDYNQGVIKEEGGWLKKNIANRVEWLNRAVEQAPRLAEFMATVKKGDGSMENLMEAMYNAADITVNFGRSGTIGKRLNQNWVPFFNPSIQGWSKACRLLTETKGARQWVGLISKAALLGIAPALINAILCGDDEEYDKIKQRDKDVNYLIKLWDGMWLKIPKGRVLSVIGMSADRVKQLAEGGEIGWGEFISTAADQIAPMNPLTDNVFASAVFAAAFNKNWYGGDIVPQSMQDDPKAEQYDATTDKLSIAIGKVFNWSPKKINYLLDSYTGVAGDIILPMLSVASQQNFISKAFVIDTDYSNRLQGDFYETKDELTERKNSSKATPADEVKYRWWNHKSQALSEITKEIKKIQSDSALSKKEKEEALQVQYVARNALLLQSEAEYDRYIAAVDKRFAENPDAEADAVYREVNREIYGAEVALQIEGKATYERAQKMVKEHGIDFGTFFDIHFDSSVDTDKAAEMIGEGFEKDSAITLAREFEALKPEVGAESVSYMQKYKAIVGADVTDEEKLFAMSIYASDSDQRRVAIGTEHDISLDQFIMVKENLEIANEAAGKSSASNARIRAAIASTDGLTLRQQAILWQLFTSSTSAKNNPFSVSIGWETVAQIETYKKAAR